MCIEVINVLNRCGYAIDIENIREGLKNVVHKGRMEQLNSNPIIVFDGAHNEPAIHNLLDMVNMYYKQKKRVYIISILARKDYQKMLKLLAKDEKATFVMTSGNDEKYTTPDELYKCMNEYVNEDRIIKKDLKIAIQDAMDADENTVNLVIGSFYTYGTVLDEIEKRKIK